MRRITRSISLAVIAAALSIALPVQNSHAQSANVSSVDNLGLSATTQSALDTAIQNAAAAMNGGTQAQQDAALAALATAVLGATTGTTADQAAAIAGAITAALPGAALTITQAASQGNPGAAAQIAVAVYTNLPADLQTASSRTAIASSAATGAGVDSGFITAALNGASSNPNGASQPGPDQSNQQPQKQTSQT